ncbi:hypothetical protein JXA34_01160 [Patescibacteria group bacterium]|nr:hypothetical protein [Patescibacteria group bacterium]
MSLSKRKKTSYKLPLFILLISLVFSQFAYGMETRKVDDEDEILDFKGKLQITSTEILYGTVKSVKNPLPSGPTNFSYFELVVSRIEKSSRDISQGDTVKIKYNTDSPLVTGSRPVLLKKDLEVKIYGIIEKRDTQYIFLKHAGDALEILNGEPPSELDYMLGMAGLNTYNLSSGVKTGLLVLGILLLALIILGILKKLLKLKS